MPTVKLNRKTFETVLGKSFEDDFLRDRISYIGTDLENLDENEINVEIFPNRPDMLSEYGFARAMSSFLGLSKGLRQYSAKPSGERVIVKKETAEVRPKTVCAIIRNIRLDDEKIKELIQIQEKLHITFCRQRKKAAIGIYPLEKIRFPITYTARKPENIAFQPLDSGREMKASEIIEQHAAGLEYGHLLKDAELYPIFVDANNEILSMPPLINSEKTGRVTEDTREFFIECSGFDLPTLKSLLNILVTAFADMGGEIFSIQVEYEGAKSATSMLITPNLSPAEMKIDHGYINKWLGLSLPKEEINACLEKMGLGISGKNADKALIPPYRPDILHLVDLAEDVAIAYGYENFKEEIPKVATIAEESPFARFKAKIARIFVGMGMQEVNTYHLTNKASQCNRMRCQLDLVELGNALNADYNVLRAWITPQMLEVLAANKTREFPQHIFDMGVIFRKHDSTETGVLEHERLAIAISHSKADFTQASESFGYLMRMLGLQYSIEEEDHPSFVPGRSARITVQGKKVAYLGEIHPEVLKSFNLEMPVAAFELNLTEIFSLLGQKTE